MPLYNYRCNKCDHTIEEFHPRDVDYSGAMCPRDIGQPYIVCGGELHKLLSAVPFTFNTGPVIKDVIHHD